MYGQSIEEALSKIMDENKILQRRLVHLEVKYAQMEWRVVVVEHHVFKQRQNDERYDTMEKFLSENFPSFKALNTGQQAVSSSRTIMDDKMTLMPNLNVNVDTSPVQQDAPKGEGHYKGDEGLGSTCNTGIARRVQQRDDQKPKEVKTPFTTSQNKKRKTRLTKKIVVRPTPMVRLAAAVDSAIIDMDKLKSSAPTPAAAQLEYPGRLMISEDMRMFINSYLKKYNDNLVSLRTVEYCSFLLGTTRYPLGTTRYFWESLGTDIFVLSGIFVENVHIFRSQIDELLTDQYLDNNHIDAFAILLVEKNKLHPGLYQQFIFVSSMQCGSVLYKYDNKQYVTHVTKESVWASNSLLMLVAEKSHWTLLVANLKSSAWLFFDSLPNLTHRVMLPDNINHLYEEILDYFEGDIRNWPLNVANGIPTQKNGFDCDIFICYIWKLLSSLVPLSGKS
ncbi:hypothetical protein IEQ34_014634 [Dendrobium chrysotoxum]|uniref:Ubiquitin-like protease family profile domain-containing protein n=1 Tax=Dendrobium chrysotoxum TaxID=161865 RepID=A0AAV7GL80_DENCH|nr:hypothetical protein IEQ34_014634 [Dendrobium chrysotoxum]